MKTIICIEGASGVGKTCTIKNVRKLLNPEKAKTETCFRDFYAILTSQMGFVDMLSRVLLNTKLQN